MLKALNTNDQLIFDRAFDRARNYVSSEAKLLESILEIDREKIFKKFGETYLTPFCVKYLKLSDAVAENFVRVARKSKVCSSARTRGTGGTARSLESQSDRISRDDAELGSLDRQGCKFK